MGEQILDRLKRAHRVGVKMAFGTDVVLDLPDRNRAELMLDYLDVWQAAGVPPAKILKSMITQPAELFRLQKECGAIQPGLAADIIAAPGRPARKHSGAAKGPLCDERGPDHSSSGSHKTRACPSLRMPDALPDASLGPAVLPASGVGPGHRHQGRRGD